MFYVYASLMVLLNVVWLLISLIGVPGNWLMIGAAAGLTWLYHGERAVFHTYTFVAVVAMAVVGEIVELAAGAVGARKFGGTAWSSVGALFGGVLGAIVGSILLPVIGTIGGAAIGAFSGAAGMEMASGRTRDESVRAGKGAALGHVTGNLSKFALGCLIWLTLAVAVFNP